MQQGSSPKALIKALLLGVTRKDLETLLGGRGRISEVLAKKRNLPLKMIRRLRRTLHIPPECLIGAATFRTTQPALRHKILVSILTDRNLN